ncbi:MAG: hypothetical protein P8K79_01980 [Mariniblastus sp.]|nr:hypothetical protein [Mariniblastus sp.]
MKVNRIRHPIGCNNTKLAAKKKQTQINGMLAMIVVQQTPGPTTSPTTNSGYIKNGLLDVSKKQHQPKAGL